MLKLLTAFSALHLATAFVAAPLSQQRHPQLRVLFGTLEDAKTVWSVDESYTSTASGLMYKDVVEGSGDSPAEEGTVHVHYKIVFDEFDDKKNVDGTVYFDSRRNNENQEPLQLQFGKTQIIKGWQEGMETMKEGGTRTLIVPPELGYGKDGLPEAGRLPAIPSRANLKFELELVKVDNSALTKLRRMIPKPSAMFDNPFF